MLNFLEKEFRLLIISFILNLIFFFTGQYLQVVLLFIIFFFIYSFSYKVLKESFKNESDSFNFFKYKLLEVLKSLKMQLMFLKLIKNLKQALFYTFSFTNTLPYNLNKNIFEKENYFIMVGLDTKKFFYKNLIFVTRKNLNFEKNGSKWCILNKNNKEINWSI